jgi:hypothetical protein
MTRVTNCRFCRLSGKNVHEMQVTRRARCEKSARRDLRRGWEETASPTLTAYRKSQKRHKKRRIQANLTAQLSRNGLFLQTRCAKRSPGLKPGVFWQFFINKKKALEERRRTKLDRLATGPKLEEFMRYFLNISIFILLSFLSALGLSPIRDDCKSYLFNNTFNSPPYVSPQHYYSISPSGKWVFELCGFFTSNSYEYDSIQLFIFQYCFPQEHIYLTSLYSRPSLKASMGFMNDLYGSYGNTWDFKEDTVYFKLIGSTINTNDTIREIFKIDVSSITGDQAKTIQQSLTPKLLKVSSHPNPFSQVTNIEYSVLKDNYVAINIYNSSGDLIKVLGQEKEKQGLHYKTWDGKDNNGNPIANGIYYYQVISGDFISAKTIIKIK